jgi:hypothetical protein
MSQQVVPFRVRERITRTLRRTLLFSYVLRVENLHYVSH